MREDTVRISISTELHNTCKSTVGLVQRNVQTVCSTDTVLIVVWVEHRYNWLKQDLEKANDNRLAVPWIIVFGHRPMYCNVAAINVTTNSTECDGEQEQSRNGAHGGPGTTSGGEVGSSDFAVEDLLYAHTLYIPAANNLLVWCPEQVRVWSRPCILWARS